MPAPHPTLYTQTHVHSPLMQLQGCLSQSKSSRVPLLPRTLHGSHLMQRKSHRSHEALPGLCSGCLPDLTSLTAPLTLQMHRPPRRSSDRKGPAPGPLHLLVILAGAFCPQIPSKFVPSPASGTSSNATFSVGPASTTPHSLYPLWLHYFSLAFYVFEVIFLFIICLPSWNISSKKWGMFFCFAHSYNPRAWHMVSAQ